MRWLTHLTSFFDFAAAEEVCYRKLKNINQKPDNRNMFNLGPHNYFETFLVAILNTLFCNVHANLFLRLLLFF